MDVYCSEAFQALTQHHILTADEEKELLRTLPFKEQCSAEDAALLPFVYKARMKKYDRPAVISELSSPPEGFAELASNADLLVQQAEVQFYNCDFNDCIRITSRVLKSDPYHTECLPIHISGLVQTNNPNGKTCSCKWHPGQIFSNFVFKFRIVPFGT